VLRLKIKRNQTVGEEIGNAVTHGVAFFLAIVALIFLLIKAESTVEYVSMAIFGMGLMLVYANSCLYHCFRPDTKVKALWKRFDHASIYLLITSTYTPFLLIAMGGPLGVSVFVVQWSLTLIGITCKCIWPKKYHPLHVVLFLALGWSGVFYMSIIARESGTLVLLTILGGVMYSAGVAFYALSRRKKYFHFIWHFFVIMGSLLHFLAIYNFIL